MSPQLKREIPADADELLTLTVFRRQVAFVVSLDCQMEVAEGLTARIAYAVLLHCLMALGGWAEDMNSQIAIHTEGGKS